MVIVELVPSDKQSAPRRTRLQHIRPLSLIASKSKPLGVTLHFCSEGAAVRVLQRRTCSVRLCDELPARKAHCEGT